MRVTRYFATNLLCILVLVIVWGSHSPSSLAQESSSYHDGQLLVQPKPGVAAEVLRRIFSDQEALEEDELPEINVKILKVPADKLEKVEQALSHNPNFKFVEKNYLAGAATVPDDTKYTSEWHLVKILAPSGWDLTRGISNVTIAICDTGVDSSHPDLVGKFINGYNVYSNNPLFNDVTGHGTAVAGTAAAMTNNTTGVAGLGWANTLMPIRMSDSSGYALYSNMAKAIDYAADHGAKVINLSFGGSSASSTLQSAVDYAWNKGCVIVASAMNNNTSAPYYPAACNHVMAVAATSSSDTKASFSNYGSWIDVSAPGTSILTTTRGGGYGAWSGTSFSSPLVAGLAALIFSLSPSLTNTQVVDLIEKNATDLGAAGFDQYFGWGRINVYKSILAAKSTGTTVDVTPPSTSITSPSNGATVGGNVTVTSSASDNASVSKVELYIDGKYFATDTTASYSFLWNTSNYANGSHSLVTKAYDPTGTVGTSTTVTVTVSNQTTTDTQAPTVSITSPKNASYVTGMVTIQLTASDNVAVTKVDIYLDGTLQASLTSGPYTSKWNSRKAAKGPHTITAKGYD